MQASGQIGSLMVRLHGKTEGEKENCVTPLVRAERAPCLRRELQDHPISSGTAVLPFGAWATARTGRSALVRGSRRAR